MHGFIAEWLQNMRWDRWEFFGLVGETLFFGRMIAQWLASERARRPVLPIVYWYMSLLGAEILFFYALHLRSFVVLLPQFIAFPLYLRNLQMEVELQLYMRMRNRAGLDAPDYQWPRVSVIVPVHNEARVLAATIENLLAQHYAGPRPEIVIALNGCTDASWAIANGYDVKVVESQACGMSLGKNLGARAAGGEVLVFVDADTILPADGLQVVVEHVLAHVRAVATVKGRPERGGPVIRAAFAIANLYARISRVHAPGGVMAMQRAVYAQTGGFDENLPQGTSTDLILRACAAGAEYVYVGRVAATTAIRRLQRRGVVRQMLDWRRNHRAMLHNRRDRIRGKKYDAVR